MTLNQRHVVVHNLKLLSSVPDCAGLVLPVVGGHGSAQAPARAESAQDEQWSRVRSRARTRDECARAECARD